MRRSKPLSYLCVNGGARASIWLAWLNVKTGCRKTQNYLEKASLVLFNVQICLPAPLKLTNKKYFAFYICTHRYVRIWVGFMLTISWQKQWLSVFLSSPWGWQFMLTTEMWLWFPSPQVKKANICISQNDKSPFLVNMKLKLLTTS